MLGRLIETKGILLFQQILQVADAADNLIDTGVLIDFFHEGVVLQVVGGDHLEARYPAPCS